MIYSSGLVSDINGKTTRILSKFKRSAGFSVSPETAPKQVQLTSAEVKEFEALKEQAGRLTTENQRLRQGLPDKQNQRVTELEAKIKSLQVDNDKLLAHNQQLKSDLIEALTEPAVEIDDVVEKATDVDTSVLLGKRLLLVSWQSSNGIAENLKDNYGMADIVIKDPKSDSPQVIKSDLNADKFDVKIIVRNGSSHDVTGYARALKRKGQTDVAIVSHNGSQLVAKAAAVVLANAKK